MAATHDQTTAEPKDIGSDIKFWRLSYSVQIELGETLKKRKRMPIITSVG
jgi:hypothetical protein